MFDYLSLVLWLCLLRISTPTDASHVFGNSFCLIAAEDFVMVWH